MWWWNMPQRTNIRNENGLGLSRFEGFHILKNVDYFYHFVLQNSKVFKFNSVQFNLLGITIYSTVYTYQSLYTFYIQLSPIIYIHKYSACTECILHTAKLNWTELQDIFGILNSVETLTGLYLSEYGNLLIWTALEWMWNEFKRARDKYGFSHKTIFTLYSIWKFVATCPRCQKRI